MSLLPDPPVHVRSGSRWHRVKDWRVSVNGNDFVRLACHGSIVNPDEDGDAFPTNDIHCRGCFPPPTAGRTVRER